MKTEPIKLLWTGGFDSTFRILYILVVEKKHVQPYYIIDSGRKSTMQELNAMEIIRSDVINKFPETKNLMLQSIYHLKTDILPNPKLNEYYNNIKSYLHIGPQYEWLASFAHQFGFEDLELCIVKPKPNSNSENSFIPILFSELEGEIHDFKLRNKVADENFRLFSYFRFPVVHLRKIDMKLFSEQCNFYDIIRKTWFCHQPTNQDRPCGVCVPCSQRIDSGVKTQIPFSKTRYVRQTWLFLKDRLRTIEPINKLWCELKRMKKLLYRNGYSRRIKISPTNR